MHNYTKTIIFSFLLVITFSVAKSQQNLNLSLEPLTIQNLGGIQAYAFGQYNGKWLIVGGRLDGLHQRQPFAAFDIAGHNTNIYVVDPENQQIWTSSISALPTSISEQLSSTNMQFIQEGNYLYCIGGYGYSNTFSDHVTYNSLTAIDVPNTINAIINGTNFTSFFRQINDNEFQVTGGRLDKIGQNYYLLGGQNFIGRYNPMGPNNGPGFIQEYTNEIRIFTITDDGTNINITHLSPYTDTVNLHRRDYNALPQIMPNGKEGITMFSGVFQYIADVPFLNCVNIDSSGYTVNNNFQQFYNHYHCPAIPLYTEQNNMMHNVFFGGIAQYYDNNGTLVQDDNVPFVNTIANVTRDANGTMLETKLNIEMPNLLGASAEFIPNLNLKHYENGVIKLDSIPNQKTLLGYIYGGIASTAPNIFFINDGTQSSASNVIYKVFIEQTDTTGIAIYNTINDIKPILYPNPNKGLLNINFSTKTKNEIKIDIKNVEQKIVYSNTVKPKNIGENAITLTLNNLLTDNIYFIDLIIDGKAHTQKLILNK
ncbi:MAG: T9SS type A sorting domain-containing protein [Chitinophagales bacterium]|nr:T9SS C-terminal target domain-containing protein [Chitinophagales bacterium]